MLWQPKTQSLGGTLDRPFNLDNGVLWHARMAENAAYAAGFNWELNQYASAGLFGGVDLPVNVDAIQRRISHMQQEVLEGGSLIGIAGENHTDFSGDLGVVAQQFAAADYSAAPDLQAGDIVDGFSAQAESIVAPYANHATPIGRDIDFGHAGSSSTHVAHTSSSYCPVMNASLKEMADDSRQLETIPSFTHEIAPKGLMMTLSSTALGRVHTIGDSLRANGVHMHDITRGEPVSPAIVPNLAITKEHRISL